MPDNVSYKDFNYRFLAHPVSGKLGVVKDADAVRQGVKLLIMTNRLERPFRPNFGADVRNQLFENIDGMTEEDTIHSIESAMTDHSDRAELIATTAYADADGRSLGVTITFRPVNQVDPVSLTIDVKQVR